MTFQITTDVAGQIGVNPRRVKIITSANYSQVTAAGYLNKAAQEGFTIYPTDLFDVIYSYTKIPVAGTYQQFTCTIASGNITLVPSLDLGNVIRPVVSGNLSEFNDVNGTLADSGISAASAALAATQVGVLKQVSVTLNPTQMAAAYATPAQLIALPAASQVILLLAASVYTASTGNTPYATGTAPIIQYGTGGTNGAHGAGTIATAAGLVAGDITASASQVRNLFQIATGAQTGLSGKGIFFSNATGAYTAGTGTNVTFTLLYQILTATI